MQPRHSFDRVLRIQIAIGVVLILGMGWMFLTSAPDKLRTAPTATPSSSNSLEAGTPTHPPLAIPSLDETPEAQTPGTATGTSPEAYPGPPAETLPATNTLVTESLPTLSATPTPNPAQLLQVGKKYDDTDPHIAYDWYWTALKNPSTANAYYGTIHASDRIGDEASFRFIGQRFRLGYKRGKNFGTVTVIVDDQSYSFDEQDFGLVWSSPKLSPGDHLVRIIHDSGESINLDYIVIVD